MRLKGISYNPKTGVICRDGKPCSNKPNGRGYKLMSLYNKSVYQHHVAWYLAYGFWPPQIDHINRDKLDNRLHNLRVCTDSTNAMNQKIRADNNSGHKGVHFNNQAGKWETKFRGKYLGIYPTLEEAVAVRREKENAHVLGAQV